MCFYINMKRWIEQYSFIEGEKKDKSNWKRASFWPDILQTKDGAFSASTGIFSSRANVLFLVINRAAYWYTSKQN